MVPLFDIIRSMTKVSDPSLISCEEDLTHLVGCQVGVDEHEGGPEEDEAHGHRALKCIVLKH